MHFQEIRRAAAQGTISLPPPANSEGLEDLAVLKSCLKVIRELSGFRYRTDAPEIEQRTTI